jgi:hypothetical protein
MREVVRKANKVVQRVWGIGEKSGKVISKGK